MQDEDVREKILLAGINCIEQYGYSGFSIRKIARASHTTVTIIYTHFHSKKEIVQLIVKRLTTVFIKKLQQYETLPAKNQLIEIILLYLKEISEHLHIYELLFSKRDFKMPQGFVSASDYFEHQVNSLINQLHPHDQVFFLRIWSLINGTSLMIKNGIIKYNNHNIKPMLLDALAQKAA